MSSKCLYCYQPTENGQDFHDKCSVAFFGISSPPILEYSLEDMDKLAKNVVERSIAVPGVQAKLSMSVVKKAKEKLKPRLTVIDALGGNYIFKPPSERFSQMPENEHLTMRIAEAFGIQVVPSSLVRLATGELSYITKRIDRTESGDKIHMIDMFQITEAFDKYKSSIEKVGKAIEIYSQNTMLDKIFFFELVVFCFLTGNNDMHLKNFSMIESSVGWVLAPAYDLLNVAIVIPNDTEELALTLGGRKRKIKREHFEALGEQLSLTPKQINAAFKRMIKNKPKALKLIDLSFLSDNMKMSYRNLLELRYQQLNLI